MYYSNWFHKKEDTGNANWYRTDLMILLRNVNNSGLFFRHFPYTQNSLKTQGEIFKKIEKLHGYFLLHNFFDQRWPIPKFLPNTNTLGNLLNNNNTKSFADILTIPIPILAMAPYQYQYPIPIQLKSPIPIPVSYTHLTLPTILLV